MDGDLRIESILWLTVIQARANSGTCRGRMKLG
jgi:hypothetical protein